MPKINYEADKKFTFILYPGLAYKISIVKEYNKIKNIIIKNIKKISKKKDV